MDLSISEHSRTLPGLKLSNPYNKLWSVGQDKPDLCVCVPPICDRSPSVQLPVQTESYSHSHDSYGPGPEPPDPSTPGFITIPRPHGRKTPELGKSLAPIVAQSRSKPAGPGEGRTTPGGQEFRQALSMNADGDLLKPLKVREDNIDLLSLLDPLKSSAQTSSSSTSDTGDTGMPSSSCKPTLPPRSYPQGLPPFPLQPHISLNPFTQPLQHTSSQMQYSPTVSGNPFGALYGPQQGSYLHTPPPPQSFPTVPGLYRQGSPGSSTVAPSYRLLQSAFPSPVTSLPHSSASNHTLSSLANSPSVPKTQDPFGDLLTMVRPATPPKKKMEDLRQRWETFD